jgi:hypothetical protein
VSGSSQVKIIGIIPVWQVTRMRPGIGQSLLTYTSVQIFQGFFLNQLVKRMDVSVRIEVSGDWHDEMANRIDECIGLTMDLGREVAKYLVPLFLSQCVNHVGMPYRRLMCVFPKLTHNVYYTLHHTINQRHHLPAPNQLRRLKRHSRSVRIKPLNADMVEMHVYVPIDAASDIALLHRR